MSDIWEDLYEKAKSVLNPREISPFVEAGGVAAAVLTRVEIFMWACVLIRRAPWECARSAMLWRI